MNPNHSAIKSVDFRVFASLRLCASAFHLRRFRFSAFPLFAFLLVTLILLCLSCGPKPQASLDLWVRNDTPMTLDNVKLQYGSHLAWRENPTLAPSNSQPILWDCERPTTGTAEVQFVERNTRQPHSAKVNIAALKSLPGGKHEIVFTLTALDQARLDVDGPPCRYNLLVIEAAKQLWASPYRGVTNPSPSWTDLRPYFPQTWTNGTPSCTAAGTYTIGRIGDYATCSVGGQAHTLQ